MASAPSTPKGTRDFNAADLAKRRYVVDLLRQAFELHGFGPLETPSFENLDTLMGKYGEEGDRLIFKILKSGNFLESVAEGASPKASQIADKALRYDLTVPFARYVAQNHGKIALPFKRYQIQPVRRADRPQKGRFREFYQCDIDVVGKDALSVRYDAEIPAVIHAVFSELAIGPFTISLNNRKILRGFFEAIGIGDGAHQAAVLREIDKIDKRGAEAVAQTLKGEGFGLSKDIRHEEIVMATEGIQRLREGDEVARNETRALVDELVEGMLSVRAWLAPVDDTGVGIDLAAVELDVLAVAFHRELLQVGGEALEVLLIREDSHALGTKKIAIPQPKETVNNGDILIEWSRAKVLIHLMKASQHIAEVIRPERDHI